MVEGKNPIPKKLFLVVPNDKEGMILDGLYKETELMDKFNKVVELSPSLEEKIIHKLIRKRFTNDREKVDFVFQKLKEPI